jgi:hypothetical protein
MGSGKEVVVPDVRLERKLRVPAESASQVLGEVLNSISRQDGMWRGFALRVALGDVRLPNVGYVAIPIHLSVTGHAARAFDITFNAANLPAAFPHFRGDFSVHDGELGESTLLLVGTYDLPMEFFGKLFDAALMPHVAQRSLENFIVEIAAACQAIVDEREAEFARYHFYAGSMP